MASALGTSNTLSRVWSGLYPVGNQALGCVFQ